nr:14264_t:CDS:2 [Entrophospora candida]CAG8587510.1 7208_t:CDS:2 [Entrophospora candida]
MSISNVPLFVSLKRNHSLINAKFEGYKLKLFDDTEHLKFYKLPQPGVSISKIPSNSKLSYKEIQNRIHFNHLFYGFGINDDKATCFYFDLENRIILIEHDQATNSLITHNLLQIPKSTKVANNLVTEYPSLISISSSLLLVTNGSGLLCLVRVKKNEDNKFFGEILHITEFFGYLDAESDTLNKNVPFVFLDGKIIYDDEKGKSDDAHILFIIYNTVKHHNLNRMIPSKEETTKTLFDISLLKMSLNKPYETEKLHVIRGTSIPLYCFIDYRGSGYVICSDSDYVVLGNSRSDQDEKIHIEQSTEHDENENENENISPSNKEEKLASYIWTQTSTDITVCFQLPVGTPKTAIHCNFSKTHLSLTIKTEDDAFDTTNTNLRPRPPLPCYAFSQFFDNIDPDASLWTIEPNIGLLTLHIEKANHKTRWSHVFHNDDGVFETLDPNEFAEFRESLEKYTTDLLASSSSNETVRFETTKPLQHPIGHEMEESIDYEGQAVTFMWISKEGLIGAKSSSSGQEFICKQFDNAKTKNSKTKPYPSVCLKSDVDGIVYSIEHSENIHVSSPLIMTHFATFNAFAFVQASKREKRFVFHDPSNRFVMIFEGNRHAYIYSHHEGKDKHGSQYIVDFREKLHGSFDIIGVQMIDEKNAIVLVLTTGHIIVLKVL